MSTTGANPKDTNLREQYILNRSFDEQFGVQAVEMVGYDAGNNVLRRATVNAAGGLVTSPASSVVSTVNSSTVALGTGAAFTGTSEVVRDYATIEVTVFSDQVSATDGFSAQQSSDGTNWDVTDTYTVPAMSAGQGKTFSFQPAASFFRIVYTNGAVAQGSFRLQTVYHYANTKASSQRAGDGVSNENDLEQVAAFGMVWNDAGAGWDRDRGYSIPKNLEIQGSAVTSLNGDIIPQTDVSNYKSAYLQVTQVGGGTVVPQVSNDAVTWVSAPAFNPSTAAGIATVTGTSAVAHFSIPLGYRYFRVRVTAYSSGTFNGLVELSTTTMTPHAYQVVISGTAVFAPTNTTTSANARATNRNASATSTAYAVKASAATLVGWHAINGKVAGSLNATPSYLHLYDAAVGSVTVGTTVPLLSLAIPASGYADLYAGFSSTFFATALSAAVTTSPDGLTSTAPTNNLVVNIWYA